MKHPNLCRPFIVEVNASATGVGTVLSQRANGSEIGVGDVGTLVKGSSLHLCH